MSFSSKLTSIFLLPKQKPLTLYVPPTVHQLLSNLLNTVSAVPMTSLNWRHSLWFGPLPLRAYYPETRLLPSPSPPPLPLCSEVTLWAKSLCRGAHFLTTREMQSAVRTTTLMAIIKQQLSGTGRNWNLHTLPLGIECHTAALICN